LLFIFIIHLSPLLPSPLFSSLSSSSPLYLSEEDFFLAEEKIIGVRVYPSWRRRGEEEGREERRGGGKTRRLSLLFLCCVHMHAYITYSYSCAYV
jgi:hypothetical protein